ncbi:MAG TPA: ABC transporter permease [Bryobacteraceae bacterium]|nr:ABC transporter permease [Bryobacteraceae bacterium]
MRFRRIIMHRLRSLFRRARADMDLQREIDLHFEQLVKEAVASGMSESEARLIARQEFGPVEKTKEECRDARRVNLIETFLRDVRYALRMIRTKPGFSVPALLSLAVGIGANIAIFTVINAVLIRSLPYPEPEKLVGVFNAAVFSGQVIRNWPLSLDMYAAYHENARSFEEFGVWIRGAAAVTGTGAPEEVTTVAMTHGVLRALGARPYLGRWFSSTDDIPGSQKTVILSYKYWQRKFGGAPRVLGRLLLIDFVPYQVIGVMPRKFEFLNFAPDVFLAQSVELGAQGSDDASYFGLARLKPGISLVQANQDIARVLSNWGARNRFWRQAAKELRITPNIHPLKQDVVGDLGAVLKILMGTLLLVLLLVCVNVANLVQVRAQARRDEFAIRAALGANWWRIARQLVIESLALAALGGAAGLSVAYVGVRLLIAHGPADLPRVAEVTIDLNSIPFALACSFLSGILFGLIAVLKSGLSSRLQNARGASQSADQVRSQKALVVAQVALALVLLVGVGLLVRSFLALSAVRAGFTHPEQIQTVRLFVPEAQIRELERVAQMQAQILHSLAAIPGVAAAFATALPLELEYHNGVPVSAEGKTPLDRIPPNRTIKQISPGLFAALGTQLIAGRDFTWDDLLSRRRVAIVSENMARESWGDPQDALGKSIRRGTDGPWSVIVGVAENVYDDGVDQPPPTLVYFPGSRRGVTFAIRTSRAGSASLVKEITASIHAVDSSLPLAQVRTLSDLYWFTMARRAFALVLLGIAAAMAVMLSLIGVYGVLAYAVAQRRREISIRLAVGAEPRAIKALFLREGLILMCIGNAIGLLSARELSPWMAALLFGVKPFDPLTYVISALVIAIAALAASYIPARRAASLNPIEALRCD